MAACVPAAGRPLVLDPACGDGAFLAGVSRHNPRAVCQGLDIDPAAVDECVSRLYGWPEAHSGQ